ncbi:MAG: cytochrome B [Saprospiraceae bacterium]|nr:cytochrome B [Saprospiraceae bacterium]
MLEMLKHAHSGFRWIVLILLLVTIFNAFKKRKGNQVWSDGDQKLALYTFISTHIQLLLGLILYFISPYVTFDMADKLSRFYSVEHISLMVIGIALITVGYIKAKKAAEGKKAKTIFTFFLIGLILILLRIPWPGMGLGANWF